MKKTLSLILALLMSISTATVALATEEVAIEDEVAVEEVTEEEVVAGPYDDAIKYLEHYGIYKGDETGLAADKDVNRWQMALYAARIATGWVDDDQWEDGPLNSSEFTDLAGTYAEKVYGAISYVNQMGIIEGYGDGRFGPTNGITYQDALTIAVRTLGYQNLEYPWGYIQKAVELGLTEGIVDVTFTDALTRGETAQIIYNALSAETKSGSTLAKDSFGMEFLWTNVVITASDRDTLTGTANTAAGFVKFQLVEDGELGAEYVAKAADFDLDGHKDDLAVGASYKVFFEKEADSDIVEIIDYKANYVETLWNTGKNNAYEIDEVIGSEYKLVTKYSETKYLGTSYGVANEIIVVDALGSIVVIEYTGASNIGIDMNTGDIVKFAEEDGEIEIVETLWYWNEIVEHYYEIVYDDDDEIGVNFMDEKDEADLLDLIKASTAVEVEKAGFGTPAAIDEDSAYASLDVYSVNGKAYGIYEEYKFGYFANSTRKCCDANRDTYVLSDVITTVNGDGVITSTTAGVKFDQIVEGECKHGTAWINPAFAANLQEDGTYADGYVIYSADTQTGEVKIVKFIDGSEEDSYVAYGTIKAYNVAEEYVVIGGQKLTFDYDNLEGAEIVFVKQNKATYADLLRPLFNQYIKYVVVDGEIVHIEVAGNKTDRLFVVEKYAGISSDSYIVVDGYWTSEPSTLARIRVASYNNNYTGDPFYNMTAEKAAKAFTKGAMYAVSSTEADGSLNVQIVGEATENGYDVFNTKYVSFGGAITIDADLCEDGYLTKNGDLIRNKEYNYVLIGMKRADGYVPMAIYSGEIADSNWTVTGTLVNDGDDNTFVIVDATWTGFGLDNGTTGVVALLGDNYFFADYDNANEDEGWYVLGSAEYEVEVFDFYTASNIIVKASNIELEEGRIYRTIDGNLVYDDALDANLLYAHLKAGYADKNATSADYMFGELEGLTAANLSKVWETIAKAVSVAKFGKDTYYKDMVTDDKVQAFTLLTIDADGKIDVAPLNADAFEDLAGDADSVTVDGFYIFNNKNGKAYVYAYADVTGSTKTTDGVEIVSDTVIEATTSKDAYIEAVSEVDVVENEDGIVSATLNKVTLSFVGAAVEGDTHKAIKDNHLFFGNAGMCANENWKCEVNGKSVYGSIVAEEGLYEGHDEEDICDLIKSVEFDIVPGVVITEETQYVTIKFVDNHGCAAEINLGVKIDAEGNIIARLSRKETCEFGGFTEVIDRPAVLNAK